MNQLTLMFKEIQSFIKNPSFFLFNIVIYYIYIYTRLNRVDLIVRSHILLEIRDIVTAMYIKGVPNIKESF